MMSIKARSYMKFQVRTFRFPSSVFRLSSGGFTLVELLVVIGIIAMLASIVIGISGYAGKKADRAKATSEIEKLKNGLEEYRLQKGSYPSNYANECFFTNQTFFNTVKAGITNNGNKYDLSEMVDVDPWGRSYIYKRTDQFQYKLWSLGPDRDDSGDDISSESGGM